MYLWSADLTFPIFKWMKITFAQIHVVEMLAKVCLIYSLQSNSKQVFFYKHWDKRQIDNLTHIYLLSDYPIKYVRYFEDNLDVFV